MGADLIVHIAKGPETLKEENISKALAHLKKVKEYAERVVAAIERQQAHQDEGEEGQEGDDKLIAEAMERGSLVYSIIDHEQHSSVEEAEDAIREFAECNPEEELGHFVVWWDTASARDTACRFDPDRTGYKIVVCGDMSWGDSPEGEGYEHMEWVWKSGLADILGIY